MDMFTEQTTIRDALARLGHPSPERTAKALVREAAEHRQWERQLWPCSGPGYAHKPHGNCPGYGSDRT